MATTGELAAGVMRHLVTHDGDGGHGYTWGNRWGDGTDEVITVDGRAFSVRNGDRDCSSAIISAWEAVLPGSTGGATYTGNMVPCFTSTGLWEWHPGTSFIASPGDIYLNIESHTAMCLTQEPDLLMEFCINEFGEVYGGRQGDQTGGESRIGPYYEYWDGILHFIGAGEPAKEKDDSDEIIIWPSNGGDNQRWYMVFNEDGTFTFRSKANGKCLDVARASTESGASVIAWPKHGGDNQRFFVETVGRHSDYASQTYRIVPKMNENLALDVKGNTDKDGTDVIVWDYHVGENQHWLIVENNDGTVTLVNNGIGKKMALDVKGVV